MTVFEDFRLSPWQEILGLLNEVDVEDCHAVIGSNNVTLPSDLLIELKSHLGRRVAILRTDDQDKPYRWRLLDKN